MRTNVRPFTDQEIFDKVELIGGVIPNHGKYWIVGMQSKEDAFNLFDDKFYVYDGPRMVLVTSGTTNAGATALKNYNKYNLPGAAVLKTNEFYKDAFKKGYHKGRMRALRQNVPFKFYRDLDKDNFAEEQGPLYEEIIWANFHGVDYDFFSDKISTNINGWSFACQVCNVMPHYRQIINATWKRNKTVDYALLKEW